MEKATVYVGHNLDGYGFSLSPRTRTRLLEIGAHPSRTLFLASDFREDFMTFHGSFLKNVFPALAGFVNEADVARFDVVEFIRPMTGEVFYRWSQRQAKELQSTENLV